MEFFRLDSSYYPSTSIDEFDTFIWNEKYQEAGDFKVVCKDDISILSVLPKGSLCSHTDTKQVMIVEDHEIKRDKDKKLLVTVTGRSFEIFADERVTVGAQTGLYNSGTNAAQPQTITAAAENAAYQLLVAAFVSPTVPTADAVPNISVVLDVRVFDTVMTHIIQRGQVYERVMELLKLASAGIRTERPISPDTTLDVIIHDGDVKTDTVVFKAQNEDLDDAEYFSSIKDYKNYAQITTHTTARTYQHRDIVTPLTGLDRRVLYVEANDIEGSFAVPTSTDAVATRAQQALDQHKLLYLVSAKISETAKPKFKIDYDIGDLVTVYGEFAPAQTMRVNGHILTVDDKGMRGYPSLSAI
jgi:hypothetical protein